MAPRNHSFLFSRTNVYNNNTRGIYFDAIVAVAVAVGVAVGVAVAVGVGCLVGCVVAVIGLNVPPPLPTLLVGPGVLVAPFVSDAEGVLMVGRRVVIGRKVGLTVASCSSSSSSL